MREVAEDRISNLPDSLLHHILSFLGIKDGARTSIISKRWNYIWTTIPTLHFENTISPRNPIWITIATEEFMDFVDGTLHRHNTSNIDKFSFTWDRHLKESRVRSWISNVIRGNLKELGLKLNQRGDNPLFISLKLNTYPSIRLPKYITFPRLKCLELSEFDYSSECWNEKLFSNSPVLEELILRFSICSMRNFSIAIPTLKLLKIDSPENGLQDCVFKIDAPRLVSFTYWSSEAKEFVFPSFRFWLSAPGMYNDSLLSGIYWEPNGADVGESDIEECKSFGNDDCPLQ
ncbi:F-box/LRR-repeat protein At4g14103-like [Papaver somniferum]|uniref:F-box/LRR-repeat protein At4g14103-like n=1 Tax=Papaver somniferum TaxID=3469 RepID=UPI000E704886|nr:F-box/LRR-repeat protein At4g14103-like [Papaver somniferum]